MPLHALSSDCCARRSIFHVARYGISRLLAGWMLFAAVANSAEGEPAGKLAGSRSGDKLASVKEMIDARTDVWGDAAMRQPNGASYEFFKDLLPPLRWVNAEFRHYPIVLSAP